MITKFDLGDPLSGQNLGNQLFQVASLFGLSKRYDTKLLIPPTWKYRKTFNVPLEVFVSDFTPTYWINEPCFHFCIEYFDKYAPFFKNEIVNINGVLQSEKYWKDYENSVRNFLRFEESVYNKIYEDNIALLQTNIVAVSVRRGDFIVNPNHYLLPFEYYAGAIKNYFPSHNVMVFTDDFKWCRKQFSKLTNKIYYSDKYTSIEQLCFMSMFSDFVISNSTFSWWGAYLSNAANKKIVRPHYVFDGILKETHNVKDHYPDEWIEYKHENVKRNKISQFLFYNDNYYRITYWLRNLLFKIYVKIGLKSIVDSFKKD